MSSKTAGLQYSPARKWCKVILATLLGVVGLFGAYIYGVTANVQQTASALDNMEILPHHRSFGQLSMSSAPEATPSNAASIVEIGQDETPRQFHDVLEEVPDIIQIETDKDVVWETEMKSGAFRPVVDDSVANIESRVARRYLRQEAKAEHVQTGERIIWSIEGTEEANLHSDNPTVREAQPKVLFLRPSDESIEISQSLQSKRPDLSHPSHSVLSRFNAFGSPRGEDKSRSHRRNVNSASRDRKDHVVKRAPLSSVYSAHNRKQDDVSTCRCEYPGEGLYDRPSYRGNDGYYSYKGKSKTEKSQVVKRRYQRGSYHNNWRALGSKSKGSKFSGSYYYHSGYWNYYGNSKRASKSKASKSSSSYGSGSGGWNRPGYVVIDGSVVLPHYHRDCVDVKFVCPGDVIDGPIWKRDCSDVLSNNWFSKRDKYSHSTSFLMVYKWGRSLTGRSKTGRTSYGINNHPRGFEATLDRSSGLDDTRRELHGMRKGFCTGKWCGASESKTERNLAVLRRPPITTSGETLLSQYTHGKDGAIVNSWSDKRVPGYGSGIAFTSHERPTVVLPADHKHCSNVPVSAPPVNCEPSPSDVFMAARPSDGPSPQTFLFPRPGTLQISGKGFDMED